MDATVMGSNYLLKTGGKWNKRHCCPLGYPIHEANANDWFFKSLQHPEWFGENGIDAFIFTHHRNCSNFFSNKWIEYNKEINRIRKLEKNNT